MIFPLSRRTIRSHQRSVDSRCAIITIVRPGMEETSRITACSVHAVEGARRFIQHQHGGLLVQRARGRWADAALLRVELPALQRRCRIFWKTFDEAAEPREIGRGSDAVHVDLRRRETKRRCCLRYVLDRRTRRARRFAEGERRHKR